MHPANTELSNVQMISRYFIHILLLLFPEIFDLVIVHRAVQSPDSLFAKTFEALQQQTESDGACDEENAEFYSGYSAPTLCKISVQGKRSSMRRS
jgi:hypothetical protein